MKKIPVFYPDTGNSDSPVAKPYQRINADGTPNESGEYILFGEYPQTKVTDGALISALGDYGSNEWTSYGYYRNGEVSDFMKYTDKEYDGAKYRGVYFTEYRPDIYFTEYRPDYCKSADSPEDSCQYANGYCTSTIYWFKYEPIKWRILKEEGGKALILSEVAIDSQQWDYETGDNYKNNYEESTIRKWLNDTFYNTAFSDMQKELIQTTKVDNSAASTEGYDPNPNVCENTNDKVFLLSYADVTNGKYGFNNNEIEEDNARKKKSTDYAKSQGCYTETETGHEGNCVWWLRSPCVESGLACHVDYYGDVYNIDYVYSTRDGVLPALILIM